MIRGDNVLVPAAAYFDPETVTVQAGSVVTYDGQARVVEQVDADGVQLLWRAERTTEMQLSPADLLPPYVLAKLRSDGRLDRDRAL